MSKGKYDVIIHAFVTSSRRNGELFGKVPSEKGAFFILVVYKRQRILNKALLFQMVAKTEHEPELGWGAGWQNRNLAK